MADKLQWKEQMLRQIDDFKLDMRSPVKSNVRSDEILKMQKQGISQTSENLMKSGVLTKFARRKLKLEQEQLGIVSSIQPSSTSAAPTTKFDCYNELSWLKVEVRRLEGEVRKLSTEKSVLLQEKSMWVTKFQEENKKWHGLLTDVKVLKAKLTTEMNDFAYQRHALRTVEINAADRALYDVCMHQLPLNGALPEITSGAQRLKAMEAHAMLTSLVTTCRQAQVEFQDKLTSLVVEAEEAYIHAHGLPTGSERAPPSHLPSAADVAAVQTMVDNVKQWTRNCCELACAVSDQPANAAGWSQQVPRGVEDEDDAQVPLGGMGPEEAAVLRKTIAQLRSKNAELTKSLKAYTKKGFVTSATSSGAIPANSSAAASSAFTSSGAGATPGGKMASGPASRRKMAAAAAASASATAVKARPPRGGAGGTSGARGGTGAGSRGGGRSGSAAAGGHQREGSAGGNVSGSDGEMVEGNTEYETDDAEAYPDTGTEADAEDLCTGVEEYMDDISVVQVPAEDAKASYDRNYASIESLLKHATRGKGTSAAAAGKGIAAPASPSSLNDFDEDAPLPDDGCEDAEADGEAVDDDGSLFDDSASQAGAYNKPPSAEAQQFLSLLTSSDNRGDSNNHIAVFRDTLTQFLHDIVTENPLLAGDEFQQLATDIVAALYDDAAVIVGQMMLDTIVATLAPEPGEEGNGMPEQAELEAAAVEYLRDKLLRDADMLQSFTTHAIYSAAVCPEITALATMAVSYMYEKEVGARS